MQKISKFFIIFLIFILINELLPTIIYMIPSSLQKYILYFPKELPASKEDVEIAGKIAVARLFFRNLLYFVLGLVITTIFKKDGLYYLLVVITIRELLLFKVSYYTAFTSINYWNILFCRLTAAFSGGIIVVLRKGREKVASG